MERNGNGAFLTHTVLVGKCTCAPSILHGTVKAKVNFRVPQNMKNVANTNNGTQQGLNVKMLHYVHVTAQSENDWECPSSSQRTSTARNILKDTQHNMQCSSYNTSFSLQYLSLGVSSQSSLTPLPRSPVNSQSNATRQHRASRDCTSCNTAGKSAQ